MSYAGSLEGGNTVFQIIKLTLHLLLFHPPVDLLNKRTN